MKIKTVIVSVLAAFLVADIRALAAAPPALVAGQTIEAREGDTWSSATFLQREGRKYQVRYADGTEEWIGADRLRVADTAGAPGAGGGAGGSAPITTDGPFTQIDLRRVISRRAISPVLVKPTTKPSIPFTDLTPTTGVDLNHPEQVIVCVDNPNLVVVVGDRRDDDTTLLCIDTTNPSASESRVFSAHDQHVIGVADGGRVLLTQPTTWGALSLHLWEYRDKKYQLKANYIFVENNQNRRADWARLLSPTRLLMRSGFGENFLIDLPTKAQVGFLECGDITLHSSGQFFIGNKDQNTLLIRPSDLAVIGESQGGQSVFTLDSTATFAAVGGGGSMSIVKIATNKTIQHVDGLNLGGHLDLLDENNLLVDGSIDYDMKTGIPMWAYRTGGGPSLMLPNGQMLYVTTLVGQTFICMAALPDENAAKALTTASPDKFLLSPGAHVAIVGDLSEYGDAAVARKNIGNSLAAAGDVADDTATEFKLTFQSAAGPTEKFGVRIFQLDGPPVTKEYDAPSTNVTMTLTLDGATILKRDLHYGSGMIVNRRQNETMEQALAEAAKPNIGGLNFLNIPRYIVKTDARGNGSSLGESELTRTGFVPVSSK